MKESFGALVDRLHEKVKAHMGWDDVKTNRWFGLPNPYFGGMSPDDYMRTRPDKVERVIDALIKGDIA